jgi:nucleoside-diphosphate-sugar epimerase
MRVLVTGGTGFIGSHIVEKLLDEGHSVVVTKRTNSSLRWIPADKVELIDAPAENLEPLADVLPEIEAVIHVAGITRANSREDFFRVNGDTVRKLLSLCDKHGSRMKRFILISSLSAAGCSRNGAPLCENTAECPYTPYGESKREGELAALEYKNRFTIGILRPPAVYGPRETGIYQYFKMINQGFIPFVGSRERKLSAVYVTDLAKASVMLLSAEFESGSAYFITDGEIHTWEEFAGQISKSLGVRTFRITIPTFFAWPVAAVTEAIAKISGNPSLISFDRIRMFKEEWICEAVLLENEIGFKPEYGLERGVEETARWYRDNGWLR